MYKIARNTFGYIPKLTPSQFLAPGYAERKLIFVLNVIRLCVDKHNELLRQAKASRKATGWIVKRRFILSVCALQTTVRSTTCARQRAAQTG